MKIIIDARYKYNYSSFYILGLRKLFGRRSITYSVKPFLSLSYSTIKEYNSGLPFIIDDNSKTYKVFIDFEDQSFISIDRYNWCDIYAKINATYDDLIKYPKLFVIGPSFGISIDNKIKTISDFILHYLKCKGNTSIGYKKYLKDYLYAFIRRRRIEKYEYKTKIRPNYIFHASTLWYNEFAWTHTNKYRGAFLKACQKAGVEIEGGLFYIGESQAVLKEMPDYPRYLIEYKDFIYRSRLKMDDYIRKTKESFVVFNTPAVCKCHGWKLAEYLCMGKAIISTPLTREMPCEGLIHGENIHFVYSEEEIYDAVIKIRDDKDYRLKLEKGARTYYEKYLAPEKVVYRIYNRYKSNI